MNHAISNALLFNLMITFVIILIAFFVGSLSYSKASKVNNRIIEEIEKHGEYGESIGSQEKIDRAYNDAACDILKWLQNGDDGNSHGIGYRMSNNRSCPSVESVSNNLDLPSASVSSVSDNIGNNSSDNACEGISINPYEYCVYQIQQCISKDNGVKKGCYTYYHVITYMYFDVPIIADLIKIPVNGQTMGFKIRDN